MAANEIEEKLPQSSTDMTDQFDQLKWRYFGSKISKMKNIPISCRKSCSKSRNESVCSYWKADSKQPIFNKLPT